MGDTSLAYGTRAPGQNSLGGLINQDKEPEVKIIQGQEGGDKTRVDEVAICYLNGLVLTASRHVT